MPKIPVLPAETVLADADLFIIEDDTESATNKITAANVQLAMMLEVGAVEWSVNTVATSGATETLDTSLYGTHDITMDESCTFTFSNPAPSGNESEFKLYLSGAFTPTFPAGVDWAGGTAPTYATPSVYVFSTVDGGTIWLGSSVGLAFA